jgi:hypothetical protein
VDAVDGGRLQIVCVEKLGLGFTAIGALSVPPASAIAIENGATGTGHGDGSAGNRYERTGPFLVVEGCFALKNNLCEEETK